MIDFYRLSITILLNSSTYFVIFKDSSESKFRLVVISITRDSSQWKQIKNNPIILCFYHFSRIIPFSWISTFGFYSNFDILKCDGQKFVQIYLLLSPATVEGGLNSLALSRNGTLCYWEWVSSPWPSDSVAHTFFFFCSGFCIACRPQVQEQSL